MPTVLNGRDFAPYTVRNGAVVASRNGKGLGAIHNGMADRELVWNGHGFPPPPVGAVLYLPGYPGQGAVTRDYHTDATIAAATLQQFVEGEKTTSQTDYTAMGNPITVVDTLSAYRITFQMQGVVSSGDTTYARIYKNGVGFGSIQTEVTGNYVSKSQDFATTLVPGDVLEIWGRVTTGTSELFLKILRLCYDPVANNGTISGATWTPLPSSLWVENFDGIDDFVDCGSALSLTSQAVGTWMMWIYPRDFAKGVGIALTEQSTDNNLIQVTVTNSTINRMLFQHYTVGHGNNVILGHTELSANTWVHLAITANGTTWNLNVNGIAQTITILAGSNNGKWINDLDAGTKILTLGKRQRLSDTLWLDGQLGLVVCSEAILTDSQIALWYQQTRSLFGV